jgi:hypothetical protein
VGAGEPAESYIWKRRGGFVWRWSAGNSGFKQALGDLRAAPQGSVSSARSVLGSPTPGRLCMSRATEQRRAAASDADHGRRKRGGAGGLMK